LTNFKEAQDDLNSRFTYKSDVTGEKWTILTDDGDVSGDCEDYVMSLVWLAEDKSYVKFWWSFLTFKYVIWQGLTPGGQGHALMWVRGQGWTDNITKGPRTWREMKILGYKLWFPIILPLMIAKFAFRPLFYLINKVSGY
jgi:predicted transglutaminase-like cysteine proteinase